MGVDMSFRPLFAHNRTLQTSTEAFDHVFGQNSARWMGVILECEPCLNVSSLSTVEKLSAALEKVPHVTQVLSATRFPYPSWAAVENPVLSLLKQPSLPDKNAVTRILQDPYLIQNVLSKNQKYALVLVDIDIPVERLKERIPVLKAVRGVVADTVGKMPHHEVGTSVIEEAYSVAVLEGLAKTSLTIAATLALLAWLIFGHWKAVLVVLSGVSVATPATLAVMQLLGDKITAINSLVPNMAMIIGVSDAIHLMCAYNTYRRESATPFEANQKMFSELLMPCLMTALTTTLGFVSLGSAQLTCIRDFGIGVSYAVCIVFVCNILLIPSLLKHIAMPVLNEDDKWINRTLDKGLTFLTQHVLKSPRKSFAAVVAALCVCALFLPKLSIVQYMNNELSQKHPARTAALLADEHFIGFYGPAVSLKNTSGHTLLDAETLSKIAAFKQDLAKHPSVQRIDSLLDTFPPNTPYNMAGAVVASNRNNAHTSPFLSPYINQEGNWAALYVRTGDIGTQKAIELGNTIEVLAHQHFKKNTDVSLQGQWWMAQHGLNYLLHDMLSSFAWACITVLPLMAFMLRKKSLILASVLPNILPSFFALCWMAMTGISMRVGTAMVLAIALGISVDSTIHLLERIRHQLSLGDTGKKAIENALHHAGRPIAYSSFILIIGFLSMCLSDLQAISDMGIVGAATLFIALVCDLTLTPSIYLLLQRTENTSPH